MPLPMKWVSTFQIPLKIDGARGTFDVGSFTSHELLSTVYHQVQPRLLEKGQEVLAQGISGSREKFLNGSLMENQMFC